MKKLLLVLMAIICLGGCDGCVLTIGDKSAQQNKPDQYITIDSVESYGTCYYINNNTQLHCNNVIVNIRK